MNEKFTCQVDITIDHDSVCPELFEYDSYYPKSKINYDVSIELRSWGIKNILFMMQDQEIEFEVELLHKEKEDPETATFKLKLHDMEVDLPENFSRGDICPSELYLTIESLEPFKSGVYQGKATGNLSFKSA